CASHLNGPGRSAHVVVGSSILGDAERPCREQRKQDQELAHDPSPPSKRSGDRSPSASSRCLFLWLRCCRRSTGPNVTGPGITHSSDPQPATERIVSPALLLVRANAQPPEATPTVGHPSVRRKRQDARRSRRA